MTEHEWILSNDTGTSSKTIWAVMMGAASGKSEDVFDFCTPSDNSDFGRCHRLLEHFPAWRERMAEVATRFPSWAALVREWPRLTELYRKQVGGDKQAGTELFKRLHELNDEGRILDGWTSAGPGCWRKGKQQSVSLGNGVTISSP